VGVLGVCGEDQYFFRHKRTWLAGWLQWL
jgi:hypothetical protein